MLLKARAMMKTKRSYPRSARDSGFTLLQMAVVIGVAAIVAAAIVPDIVEASRNRYAEVTVGQIAALHDAARDYYANSPLNRGLWPAEVGQNECTTGIGSESQYSANAKRLLAVGGWVPGYSAGAVTYSTNAYQNAWGGNYDLSLYYVNNGTAAGPSQLPSCMFGVATEVPTAVMEVFLSNLPMSACNPANSATGPCPQDPNGVPASGFQYCCSYVTRPSLSALCIKNGKNAAVWSNPVSQTGTLECL
jgi:type II secretory pathway pseudopilin PulG